MDLKIVASALESRGYSASIHPDRASARDHIVSGCRVCVVGFGDSRTLEAMALDDALSDSCTVIDPARTTDNDSFLEVARRAMSADVFVTSVNAMSEDGVIVNIDGTGNRVAGSLFGHRRMIYVISRNKIVPDLDSAIERARNVAAPMNARRYGLRTPCVRDGRCHDCRSHDRICNAILVQLRSMNDMDEEVVLIDEDLGFRGPLASILCGSADHPPPRRSCPDPRRSCQRS